MPLPYYVSPEQMMKDKAEYARKGIARGRSMIALEYRDGILLVAENPSTLLHKISEIYDRIAFAGVGKYNEFENLRIAGVRHADLKGYSYHREDVTAKALYRNLHLYGMFEAADRAMSKELIDRTSQLLAVFSDPDRDLAEATLNLLPREVPVARLHIPGAGASSRVAALLSVLHIVGDAGEARGVDPGRPQVPAFGRQIYHLQSFSKSRFSRLPAETTAIARKVPAVLPAV